MEALRRTRMMRGMNQVDLAQASGVSQNTISEIETGRREARAATLRKLASALEVEIADFLEDDYPKVQELPLRNTEAEVSALPEVEVLFEAEYTPDNFDEVESEAQEVSREASRHYVLEGVQKLAYYDSGDKIEVRIEPVSPASSRVRRKGLQSTRLRRGRKAG